MCNHLLVLGPDPGSRQPWVNLLLKKKLTQCFHKFKLIFHCSLSWTFLHILVSGDLEVHVDFLVQIDKLVQLIESPIFTCKFLMILYYYYSTCIYMNFRNAQLHSQTFQRFCFLDIRLQLLDTQNNFYLLKSLYGLLMLLPQSDAFTTLRHRLDCVPNGHILQTPQTK